LIRVVQKFDFRHKFHVLIVAHIFNILKGMRVSSAP
jgi:hypothetical protein